MDRGHNVCAYSHGCTLKVSNKESVEILRGALEHTKELLRNYGIPYILYGGSAIGQYRCQDVLPWDRWLTSLLLVLDLVFWAARSEKCKPTGHPAGGHEKAFAFHTYTSGSREVLPESEKVFETAGATALARLVARKQVVNQCNHNLCP